MDNGQVSAGECGCGVDAVLSWEPGAGGNKLKEPTSLGEVIDQAVQQDQVTAQSVKEVVCSLVLKISLAWHRFSVEWVTAEVLVDQNEEVQRAVEGLKIGLSANRRLEPARRALWEVVFCIGRVAMRASARIGHDN